MQASFAHRSHHHHRQHTPPTISTAPTTTGSKLRSPSSMSPRSGGFSVSTTTSPSSSSMTTADILKTKNRRKKTELPPVFGYMERGDWPKACETLRRHPREAKTWATIRIKAQNEMTSSPSANSSKPATMETKRLALHHACFKLRGAGALPAPANIQQDPYVQVCRLILMLITLYPEAAGQRESRHGCLPLHLAAFASCAPRAEAAEPNVESEVTSSTTSTANNNNPLRRPATMTRRAASDATTDTVHTHLSAVHAEERYTGVMSDRAMRRRPGPGISVSLSKHSAIPPHREELLVQVLNALLDAHPRGIRSDSEGGRNALHTACAGRATPRVVATLVQADRSAARQRNKDGFLPLHLAAHWGVSHPAVVVCLLRAYPDATVGRNRWERTPLEEALVMAGENGRPHQGALVRALRKHPDYWTRPVSEVVEAPVTAAVRAPVDMDVSLPSNESSHDEHERAPVKQSLLDQVGIEQAAGNGNGSTEVFSFGNIMQHLTGTVPAAPPAPPRKKNRDPSVPLVDLIRAQDWQGVEERLVAMPLQSEEELQVLTQGGFMASTGMTPLHFACERQPPVSVVQTFVEAFPVAVLTRTLPGGCLPVHISCTWHAAPAVVQALLQADPGSAQVKDELGNLPLHSACFSGADEAVVQALLSADPNAVLRRNHQGSKPADICKRLRHANRSAILLLLKQQETAARHRRGRSSGTWSEVATLAEEVNRREGAPGSSTAHSSMQQQDRNFDDMVVAEAPEEMVDEELVWI